MALFVNLHTKFLKIPQLSLVRLCKWCENFNLIPPDLITQDAALSLRTAYVASHTLSTPRPLRPAHLLLFPEVQNQTVSCPFGETSRTSLPKWVWQSWLPFCDQYPSSFLLFNDSNIHWLVPKTQEPPHLLHWALIPEHCPSPIIIPTVVYYKSLVGAPCLTFSSMEKKEVKLIFQSWHLQCLPTSLGLNLIIHKPLLSTCCDSGIMHQEMIRQKRWHLSWRVWGPGAPRSQGQGTELSVPTPTSIFYPGNSCQAHVAWQWYSSRLGFKPEQKRCSEFSGSWFLPWMREGCCG